jgi:hypothetical protein
MNGPNADFWAVRRQGGELASAPRDPDSRRLSKDIGLSTATAPHLKQPFGYLRGAFARGDRPTADLFVWAAVVAVLMSGQFLFQPFIWRNFAWDQIVVGWLLVVRDRLVVAIAIAAALAVLIRTTRLGRRVQLLLSAAAIMVGAGIGEEVLALINPYGDRQDLISIAGRMVRWTLVGGAIAAMLRLWRSEAELAAAAQETQIQEARLRRLAASSEFEMLRRQIEPHFLFNTLATVRRLQEVEPERGQKLLGRLLQYMSATLAGPKDARSTLNREVELVRAYLDVCASRMNGRLWVRVDVPEALGAIDFPPLILATLAENAVKHGVFPKDGGAIVIAAERKDDVVEVSLADDGVGFSGDGGSGIGLANIAERLRLIYGPRARLTLTTNTPCGVRAVVRLPLGVDAP